MEIKRLKELNKGASVFDVIAKLIVSMRYVIFVLFTIACIYCFLSVGKVKVNSDLAAFLPAQSETRRGLTVMENEFVTYGTAEVMVSNVTYERAEALSEEIRNVAHVTGVEFDNTKA
ncbi:MAG: RND transporter, partial [Oscillospiraceae bacterium]|nr:RND transporter [Oscillospiraceae bacterium]